MTITNTDREITYTGNGSTTVFSYGFKVPLAVDMNVALYEIATGILAAPMSSSLYSVTGLGDDAGGNVTYPLSGSPLAATHKIVIYRSVAQEQVTNLTNQSAYLPEVLEGQLDLLVMMTQELAEAVARSVQVVLGSGDDPATLIATLTAQSAAATASAASAAADAVSTAADVVSTNADASSTAADALATAADLVQTALDVIATNADAVSTAADAASTTADAASTASDATDTGVDAAATAADAIATAADAVSTAADVIAAAASAAAALASENAAAATLANAIVKDGSVAMTDTFDAGTQDIDNVKFIYLKEQASAGADIAGKGQLRVKTATPNELWFTDDAGNDSQLSNLGGPGVLLSTTDITSATATADFTIPTGWDLITIYITVARSVTDDVDMWLRTSTDGGSSFASGASDYYYMAYGLNDLGSAIANDSTGANTIRLHGTAGQGNTNNDRAQGVIKIYRPALTGSRTNITWEWSYRSAAGSYRMVTGAGARLNSEDLDTLRMRYSSGDISSMKAYVFGSVLT